MPKKQQNDDLTSETINLLPEEFRSAEGRARRSGAKEQLYQLRAPKRQRRRRRLFAWLPIFGGDPWKTGGPVASSAAPKVPAPTHVVQAMPSMPAETQPVATMHQPQRLWSGDVHVLPSSGVPGASRKKSSFFGRFFGKKTMSPTPMIQGSGVSSFSAPARHYSLLNDQPASMVPGPARPPQTMTPPPPVRENAVPFTNSTGGLATPAIDAVDDASRADAEEKRKGLFSWFAGLFGHRSTHRHTTPLRKHRLVPVPAIDYHSGTVPAIEVPISTELPSRTVQNATALPDVSSQPTRRADAITPIAEPFAAAAAPQTRSRDWLPRWLNIFFWFSYIFSNTEPVKKKSRLSSAVPPQESIEVPTPKSPAVPTVPPMQSSIPQPPRPVLQDITPVMPEAPASPAMPSIPTSAPTPQTPTPLPPKPEAPAEERPAQKKIGALGRFHIPTKNGSTHAPDASIVNLIPAKYSVMRSWRQITRAISITAGVSIALAATVWVGLDFWQRSIETRTTEIDQEIAEFQRKLLVYENDYEPKMTALGDRIDVVSGLLDRHIYWTNFFELLEKYTLPDVHYDGLSASTNGTLSLSAHGRNFETISKQLLLLQSEDAKEFVTKVIINGGQRSESEAGEEVAFSIGLTLNPKLFYYGDPE